MSYTYYEGWTEDQRVNFKAWCVKVFGRLAHANKMLKEVQGLMADYDTHFKSLIGSTGSDATFPNGAGNNHADVLTNLAGASDILKGDFTKLEAEVDGLITGFLDDDTQQRLARFAGLNATLDA